MTANLSSTTPQTSPQSASSVLCASSSSLSTAVSNNHTSHNLRSRRQQADDDTISLLSDDTNSVPPNASNTQQSIERFNTYKRKLRDERKKITVFRSPIRTLYIFTHICIDGIKSLLLYLSKHHTLMYSTMTPTLLFILLLYIPGHHQHWMEYIMHELSFAAWWIALGVLSSVGLGTGLHTFVLYLGPYIARVTLAATECGTLDIPTDGVHAFTCPIHTHNNIHNDEVTFWGIVYKVLPAAFLWGAGTAIGELPPYFVSRAAALSGEKVEDLEELTSDHNNTNGTTDTNNHVSNESYIHSLIPSSLRMEALKSRVYGYLQRYGFWAILCMASIPNPLFDLAGLTCGHFLVPFMTFFGATLIGKAIIKVNIQSFVVIMAFSKDTLEDIINSVESHIPYLEGKLLHYFEQQRNQFHLHTDSSYTHNNTEDEFNVLSFVWNIILFIMIGGFLKSIIDSKVQEYVAEQHSEKINHYIEKHNLEDTLNQSTVIQSSDDLRDRSDSNISTTSMNGN